MRCTHLLANLIKVFVVTQRPMIGQGDIKILAIYGARSRARWTRADDEDQSLRMWGRTLTEFRPSFFECAPVSSGPH